MALERDEVAAALREAGGDLNRAARRLGCSRRTLQYRMEEYGLSHDDGGPARGRGRPKSKLRRQSRGGGLVAGAALVTLAAVTAAKLRS